MRLLIGGVFLLASQSFVVNAQSADPVAWLQRATTASHQLNYTGNFVYQHGSQVETSRITHRVDESGEQEKLEALDGPPRIIIRNNDEVLCYLQGNKTVKLERRGSRKFFPDLLPHQLSEFADSYNVKLGGQERVADHDCQIILLEPRDNFRYGHKLWADMTTGLLLKAGMFNEKNQMVDQFSFTAITIGGVVSKEQFKHPSVGFNSRQPENISLYDKESVGTGWTVTQLPLGFKKILELKRNMPGRTTPVSHLVYSDGLVAVSIFIEPNGTAKLVEGLTSQGAINVYIRQVADHQVTALGEVPAVTVMQIANSLIPTTSQ
jgi:sigma-E factor negative regulatory protein RseB